MSEKGIVWPGEKNKYKAPAYNGSQAVPPPYWRGATGEFGFPNGYNDSTIFNPTDNEHFMVWMRTAGLPTFRKLYKRQDTEPMPAGRYLIRIHDSE